MLWGIGLTGVLCSAGLAAATWTNQRQQILKANAIQNDADAGLLELRVNFHRITALDWGHWDTAYAYASGENPAFVSRELEQSSIVSDGQSTWLFDRRGSLLAARGSPVSPALASCLRQRLQHLQQVSGMAASDKTFGFLCQQDEEIVLGAGIGIRRSSGSGPERGWLLQFGRLQRPSFTTALNRTFARIAGQLQVEQGRGSAGQPLPLLSELLPSGQRLGLLPLQSPLQVRLLALQHATLPWLAMSGLLVLGGNVSLLGLRHARWLERRRDRQARQRLRRLRQEVACSLLSQSELLMQANRAPEQFRSCSLVSLQLQISLFSSRFTKRSDATRQAVARLATILRQQPGSRGLAQGEDGNVLLLFEPPPSEESSDQDPLEWLEQHLDALKTDLAADLRLQISGLLCPLVPESWQQQLADLSLLLNQPSRQGLLLSLTADELQQEAQQLRSQLQQDFSLHHLAEDLQGTHYKLEPVINLQEHQQREAYSEMLFRLGDSPPEGLTIQALVLSLERHGNIHLLDEHMLRQAISLLEEQSSSEQMLGINVSAKSLQSSLHFEALLDQLRVLPEQLRRRLVLEITETALHEDMDLQGERLEQLRKLKVAIAIDDFGVGFASINYLFRFSPDFIKLDLSYSQQLWNPKVDALVSFLLRYGADYHSQLILEGIETEEQLHYWRQRGVHLFQGYLFLTDTLRSEAASSA